LVENFYKAFNITHVSKELNHQDYSLAIAYSTFKTRVVPHMGYEIGMR
jgi:hypothetical protein